MDKAYCQCETPELETLFPVSAEGGGSYELQRCSNCQLVWDSPMPDAEQLDAAYSQEYYSSTDAKFNPLIEAWTRFGGRRRASSLLRQHGGFGNLRVLDVGCGRGVLLQGFKDAGADVLGIERTNAGFDEIEGVEDLSLDDLIASGRLFDIIVIWHVLEHLPDPVENLIKCHQLLVNNGCLFIEVPNFDSFQARLFRSNWFHLDLPRHLFHFTPNSLRTSLRAADFQVEAENTFSLDQNCYGFLQSSLNALPLLPTNQLYGLLHGKPSVAAILGILLYTPLAIALSLPALLELVVSTMMSKGAVISVQATPVTRDEE